MIDKPEITFPRQQITAVILAGGMARRMNGQDKGLIELNGRALVEHIITALKPQVGPIIINANRNLDSYTRYGYPVVQDMTGDYPGPLAGMASGMKASDTPYILTVPCDSPFLPNALSEILFHTLIDGKAEVSVAHDGTRMQQVFTLLRRELLADMLAYLENGGRKVETWLTQHKFAVADFSRWPDAFLNINTPPDKAVLEQKMVQIKLV